MPFSTYLPVVYCVPLYRTNGRTAGHVFIAPGNSKARNDQEFSPCSAELWKLSVKDYLSL